ncbi:MAG TPA: S9 family peptidase [Gaiellaceae bacterium]|nr:S9 family peptidase [Gaiellaceae bacterium]
MPALRDLLEMRIAAPADLSGDGSFALVSSDLSGMPQLYRQPLDGGELVQLTDQPDPVVGFLLPGSGRVLLQMDDRGNELEQLYTLDPEPGAVPEPLVVEPEFFHRTPAASRDGNLLAYASNRRNGVDWDVVVRDLESGEERIVYDGGGWTQVAGFSPDGSLVALIKLTDRSGDNDLLLVDAATGEWFSAVPHEDDSEVGAPAWLPSGDAFYFATSVGRDTIAIARYELAERRWSYVIEDQWDLQCAVDEAGRNLLVSWNDDGYSRLELRDPETCELRREVQLPGRGVAAGAVFSRDGGLFAYHFTSPLVAGDAWVCDTETGASRRLTESPSDVDPAELVEPELYRFESFDGESVPVFLYRPAAPGPHPVVIMIHGGPEAQLRPIFSPLAQYFVTNGFAVAAPNVRGSTGYGKRYEHLDDVEKRLDSVRDLVSLHEWLGTIDAIDASRSVLYGGSYGGYMVLAGLAFHPDRWAAGIEIVGISSLVTFLENTAAWRRAFREREYGSLERDREFLLEASPLTRVDEIRAPLFIIHGANDPRVPVGEARQIHQSLTERGIPCELLVYEDEGHGLKKLRNRLDAYPRAAEFLARVLAD